MIVSEDDEGLIEDYVPSTTNHDDYFEEQPVAPIIPYVTKRGVAFQKIEKRDGFTSMTLDIISRTMVVSEIEKCAIMNSLKQYPESKTSPTIPRFYIIFMYLRNNIAMSHSITSYFSIEVFIRSECKKDYQIMQSFANNLGLNQEEVHRILNPSFEAYIRGYLLLLRTMLQSKFVLTIDDNNFLSDKSSPFAEKCKKVTLAAKRILYVGSRESAFNAPTWFHLFDKMLVPLIRCTIEIFGHTELENSLMEFAKTYKLASNVKLSTCLEQEIREATVLGLKPSMYN